MRSVGRSYLVLAAAVLVAAAVVASLHVRTSAGRTQVIRILSLSSHLLGHRHSIRAAAKLESLTATAFILWTSSLCLLVQAAAMPCVLAATSRQVRTTRWSELVRAAAMGIASTVTALDRSKNIDGDQAEEYNLHQNTVPELGWCCPDSTRTDLRRNSRKPGSHAEGG